MSAGNPLQSPKELMNIVLKLPYGMRDRWRRRCHNIHMRFNEVRFGDLVDYILEELSVMKLPTFGNISDPKKKTQPSSENRSRKVLATTSPIDNTSNKYCYYCKRNDHYITTCKLFEKLTGDEKSEFVKKTGLCFACLRSRHISKDCKFKLKCSTCSKTHPTILHYFNRPSPGNSSQPEENADTQPSTSGQTTV